MLPNVSTPGNSQFEQALALLPIAPAFKRFMVPSGLGRIYSADLGCSSPRDFVAGMLRRVGVTIQVTDADLERVPKSGPVVVAANHPYGILDGLMLFEILSRIRPDVKILANSLLSRFPEMDTRLILVDPFETPTAAVGNRCGVRETIRFLSEGGLLIVFPAGEVSHVQVRQGKIVDPDWNQNISRFIRKSHSTVVPVYVKGANSLTFQLAGMIHSQLRTARLLHELMNKQEKTIELRIAHPIACEALDRLKTARERTNYLRFRTYLLKDRVEKHLEAGLWAMPKLLRPRERKPVRDVVSPAPRDRLAAEVAGLAKLAGSGDLEVCLARAEEAPNVLQEIGRLRETTFRLVSEGTGRALDLDRFDRYYRHVFLWDKSARAVAGAYRLGLTSDILPLFGIKGLYTATLFHFQKHFFEQIGPAIELGRSFVCQQYQRQYGPLLLLWRGIGQFISNQPENPILFGPVSISNGYNPVSRRLIAQCLQAQGSIKPLSSLVRPRRKFHAGKRGADNEIISRMVLDAEELSAVTADIELDGKGIPVLLKQYLKLGGKLLGFGLDPLFSNALDGLILVDLRKTEPAILQRYLGREGSNRFMSYHRSAAAVANLLRTE